MHDDLKVIYGITFALIIIYLIFRADWLLFVSIFLLFSLILELKFLNKLAFWWSSFFRFIFTLISNIVITLIYILFIIPYSVLFRFFNKHIYNKFFDNNRKSHFIVVNKVFSKETFNKLW